LQRVMFMGKELQNSMVSCDMEWVGIDVVLAMCSGLYIFCLKLEMCNIYNVRM